MAADNKTPGPRPGPETGRPIGVVLAGGLSQRMGGVDKPLARLAGRAILSHVLERAQPQVDVLLLNANGDAARFAEFDLPVVADEIPGFAGPLAGVLAALDWTAVHRPDQAWVVSFACDCPFLPPDLAVRLDEARSRAGAELALAESGGNLQPVFGLWPVARRQALRHALFVEGERSTRRWAGQHRLATASWAAEPIDPFFNINTPDDLAVAERLFAGDMTPARSAPQAPHAAG